MQALMRPSPGEDKENKAFHDWLLETCSNKNSSEPVRQKRLIAWQQAPSARYAHPREEHLLPLHVCYGASEQSASVIFDDTMMGKKVCGFQW
jgi:aromatic ring-opening dioxygenase catalytic subunit (LigB family)